MKKIRFMRHYVTDGETKAKVHYSACDSYGLPGNKRKAVTLYEQGYDRNLVKVFSNGYSNENGFNVPEYKNESDMQSDYFDKGHITLYEDHPLYQEALNKANEIQAERKARWDKKHTMAV